MTQVVSPTLAVLSSSQFIKQGAEAKVYKGTLHPLPFPAASHQTRETQPTAKKQEADDEGEPILLKHRFPKQYRHKTLDTTLTKARVAGETRVLMKCLRSGVSVPGIRMVDTSEGVIGIEWIEGQSVRILLGAEDEDVDEDPSSAIVADGLNAEIPPSDDSLHDGASGLSDYGLDSSEVMSLIGTEIGKMHLADVVHGDLTTSNMMLRSPSSPPSSFLETSLVLIDFGLSYVSALVEDKAVDLYVLERAFASTHPNSEPLFQLVLESYARRSGKAWEPVRKKLEEGEWMHT